VVPGDEGRARRRAKRRLPPLGRKPMPNPRFVRFAQQLPGYRLGRWCYRRIRPLTLEEWRYNAETVAVMERVLRADSIGLDIGAHAGSILRDLVRLAPRGSHWTFEPLPAFAARSTDRLPACRGLRGRRQRRRAPGGGAGSSGGTSRRTWTPDGRS